MVDSILFDCTSERDSEGFRLLCCTKDCYKYYLYHCEHCKKTKPVKVSSERFSGTSLSTLRDDVKENSDPDLAVIAEEVVGPPV